jgi:3-oxoacyl-[acyl-carrier protein] reductase
MRLHDRVGLVTGASKGIGAEIALEFAREGADVVVNYCSDEAGALGVKKQIESLGRRAIVSRADVSKKNEVDLMVQQAMSTFGKVDILVNNSGIAVWKPFIEIEETDWDRTLGVNLKGAFLCSQAVVRHMIETGGGSIINISSIAANGAMDCLAPYCASKGGMTLLTKALAVELAPYNIRVNALAPGTIDIERNRNTDPNYPDDWLPFIPMGRVGVCSDVAKPVAFLASDDSAYITGQLIYACGGETDYVPMPRADFARGKE